MTSTEHLANILALATADRALVNGNFLSNVFQRFAALAFCARIKLNQRHSLLLRARNPKAVQNVQRLLIFKTVHPFQAEAERM
jgi:hypothetical protein